MEKPKRLNVGRIRGLTKPGRYPDGQTLYMNVAKGGSKSWVQRVVIDGKRHDIGLGPYPRVSLREAREVAFENRSRIFRGENPLAAKRRDAREVNMPTFSEAATLTRQSLSHLWRSTKTARQWRQEMERHVFPVIGKTPVDEIGQPDVLRVLTPIWAATPETAGRIRANMRKTFDWCIAHAFRSDNPAGAAINGALPTRRRKRKHHKALHYRDLARALATVESGSGFPATKLAIRFLILTATRTGEVRRATWNEIDMDEGVWRIPENRMKVEKEHRVPLSRAALDVLENAKSLGNQTGWIFPSPHGSRRGNSLSPHALKKRLQDLGITETLHGMRSSFRDWCAETGKPRELAEAALAHTVGGTEGAYFRSDLFDRRRVLMQQWADFLTGESATIVEFKRA